MKVRSNAVASRKARKKSIGAVAGADEEKLGACQPWRGRFVNNHCVEVSSSFGSLIHAAVGIAGGSGGLRTKRSGWVS